VNDSLDRLKAALAERYTIEREIGAGGMATVYLAEDVKHKRQVAVKVLRPELAAILGGDRFLKEIEVTANLQHPNILPLYDSGEADSFLYYVMPYIEGESLRDKMNREKQVSVDETVEIVRSVAAALQFAHERDVVHRDIKPENILLQSGQALVADFGIALAVSQAGGTRLTETGLSLGTPHYMSPEQATGDRDLDAKSDVYSLGCVAYEMLVGEPPHVGNSVQAVIAKVLSEKPSPISQTRDLVPSNVDAAIQQALAKSPADRFTGAGRFADALSNPGFTLPTIAAAAPSVTAGPWNRLAMTLGVVAVVATAVAIWALGSSNETTANVVRFELTLPEESAVQPFAGFFAAPFDVSPDGSRIVYSGLVPSGQSQLYVRGLDQLDPVPIPATDSARAPFFSPDGLWVGFHVLNRLKKVPLGGGPATTLAENVQDGFSGASWGDDGYIVYTAQEYRLARVNAAGGEPELLLPEDLDVDAYWPDVLPSGKGVLFQHCPVGPCDPVASVAVLDRESGEVKVLVESAEIGLYSPTGHIVYAREDGAIFAVGFDPDALELTGAAMPLFDGVSMGRRGAARLAFSRSGTMVFLSGGGSAGTQLAALDHQGNAQLLGAPTRVYFEPRLSPSGDRVAVTVVEGDGAQVWIYDIAAGTSTQLTFEGTNVRPAWSPDGAHISFPSNRTGAWELYVMPADRSGPAEPISATELNASNGLPHTWTRDGAWIVFDMQVEAADRDILAIPMGGDRTPQPIVSQPQRQRNASVSPDGRWLAYVSNESGNDEVYVRPFPGPGGVWKVSTNGGRAPAWVSDRELVFSRLSDMMELAILEFGTAVRVTERRELFDRGPYYAGGGGAVHYDLSRDGQQFVMLAERGGEGPVAPVVVLNWFEEIKRRAIEQGGH
jgi:Tol biopolymer transport system component/tRNA A-37 threonylcarbamoyl transferase component Bud32